MSAVRRLSLRPWMAALAACLLVVVGVVLANERDPLALVTLGTRFSQGIPAESGGTEGYDGQFVYYIARDPATAAPYLDVPAYRFQRILLPALGWALSFGQVGIIPWVLLFINLAAVATGTLLLEHMLAQHHVSRWYALTYGLTLGILGSVRLSLPEPLAYALVLGGISLVARERWLAGAVVFALAALAKETTLIFAAGYVIDLLWRRRARLAVQFGAICVIPFAVWQWILLDRFGMLGIGSGGALATPFEIIPFAGVLRIITETDPQARLAVMLILGAVLVPFVLAPTLWALGRCWRDWRAGAWSLSSVLLLVNAAVMLFVPFSTYREPVGILRFIVGLQIAVILYSAYTHSGRALRYSTIWSVTALFIMALVTPG